MISYFNALVMRRSIVLLVFILYGHLVYSQNHFQDYYVSWPWQDFVQTPTGGGGGVSARIENDILTVIFNAGFSATPLKGGAIKQILSIPQLPLGDIQLGQIAMGNYTTFIRDRYLYVIAYGPNNPVAGFGVASYGSPVTFTIDLKLLVCGYDMNPGIIGHNQTIDYNTTPSSFSNVESAIGSGGAINYNWQYSIIGSENWQNIAPSNSASFTPNIPLTKTANYRRVATLDNCSKEVFSNIITATVRDFANLTTNASFYNIGETITLSWIKNFSNNVDIKIRVNGSLIQNPILSNISGEAVNWTLPVKFGEISIHNKYITLLLYKTGTNISLDYENLGVISGKITVPVSVLTVGDLYRISWNFNATELATSSHPFLELWQNGQFIQYITYLTSPEQYQDWTVSSNLWGSGYTFRIALDGVTYAESSEFKINNCNSLDGGEISGNQLVNDDVVPNVITNTKLPFGDIDTFSYIWESSSNGDSNWQAASGVNNNNFYEPELLGLTTYFRRKVASSDCINSAYSNVVKITVSHSTTSLTIEESSKTGIGEVVALSWTKNFSAGVDIRIRTNGYLIETPILNNNIANNISWQIPAKVEGSVLLNKYLTFHIYKTGTNISLDYEDFDIITKGKVILPFNTLAIGELYRISWNFNATELATSSHPFLELWQNGQFIQYITYLTSPEQYQDWTVSSNLWGSGYTFRIALDGVTYAESSEFQIFSNSANLTIDPSSQTGIGEIVALNWTKNFSAGVDIRIRANGYLIETPILNSNIANNISWQIPHKFRGIELFNKYLIFHIYKTGTNISLDYENLGIINGGKITLPFNSLIVGELYRISWNFDATELATSSHPFLELWKDGQFKQYITYLTSPEQYRDWTVSSDLWGSGYTFRIALDGVTYAESEEFEISISLSQIDRNFIIEETFTSPFIEYENVLKSKEDGVLVFDFHDGLGRREQIVEIAYSPSGKDVIRPIVYNSLGQNNFNMLPYMEDYTSNIFREDYNQRQYNFYQSSLNIAHDPFPYSEKIFEPSPLNRVMEQGAPGAAWQPVEGNPAAGKTVKFGYEINTVEDKVYQWFINEADQWPSKAAEGGYYPTSELYKNITTDEEGNKVIEFIDKLQRTILKRVQAVDAPNTTTYVAGEWADTYYIYDDFNNLRFVLPPEASKQASDSPSTAFLNQWAFQYQYDGRRRMVKKQVPGAGAVYLVYDNRDRLVLTQDSVQRAQDKWLFTKYDAFNRLVATGIYTNASTRTDMQTIVNSFYTNLQIDQAWYESSGDTRYNYDNISFPQTPLAEDYLTVTYYDNYTVADTWSMDYVDAQLTQTTNAIYSTETTNFTRVKGQVTGSMVKNLDNGTWLKTVIYYDDRYRVIQTVASNHLGGIDRMSNLYDFVGKVLQTKATHTANTDTNEILETITYDHAGRLLEVKQKLDNDPTTEIVLLAQNYNELGELIEKNLHSEDGGNSFAQSVDYRYNIRGWLTNINDNNLSDGEGDYFGMELMYNDAPEGTLGNEALFNGNISAVKWTSGVTGSEQQAYTYGYDPMNRITNATSKKLNGTWLAGNTNMSVGGYDLNGNILSLTRNMLGSTMDNLTYDYAGSGNQLQKVDDSSGNVKGFKDGINSGNDYAYDGNGNMTEDKNKDIASIEYNHLNLPSKVIKEDGQYITYIYDAAGIKLAQEVYNASDELQKRTDYSGAFVYEKNGIDPTELQFIQTGEGRIVFEQGSPVYQYNLKDHLGNTRVSFTTKDETDTYLATMETEYRAYETATFTNVEETDKQDQLFNNTLPDANVAIPAYSAMLNSVATQIMGPAKSISVAPGDVINLEVWAKYATASYNGNGNKVLANTMLAAIATAFTPVGATAEIAQQILNQFTTAGAGALSPAANTDAPAAYLNYLLFDANYVLIQSGFAGVSTAAEGSFEKLETIPPVSITQAGYLYVYVSNEDAANVNVYFDDLKITHTKSKIVQMDNYYPFGLTFNSYQRPSGKKNDFLYNGKEMQDELGLDWMDYGARMYDAAIGRWMVVDPLADEMASWSPYNYAFDNPIRFTDPTGLAPEWIPNMNEDGSVSYIAEKGDNAVTFMQQFGLSGNDAAEIINKNGMGVESIENIAEGTSISGESVAEVTGSEVLKLDMTSEEATPQRKVNQVGFALEYSKSKGATTMNLKEYTSNLKESVTNGWTGTGGLTVKGKMNMDGVRVPVYINAKVSWNIDQNNWTFNNSRTHENTRTRFDFSSPKSNTPIMLISVPVKYENYANKFINK